VGTAASGSVASANGPVAEEALETGADVTGGDTLRGVERPDSVIVSGRPGRRIDDNESMVVTVAYSVAVGAANYLPEPIDVSIVDGVASFAQPLPAVVGRGDRVEIEGIGTVFIDRCFDDSTCSLCWRFPPPPPLVLWRRRCTVPPTPITSAPLIWSPSTASSSWCATAASRTGRRS